MGDIPSDFFSYMRPNYIVLFRYQITLFATYKLSFLGFALCLLGSSIINAMFDLVLHTKYINLPIIY